MKLKLTKYGPRLYVFKIKEFDQWLKQMSDAIDYFFLIYDTTKRTPEDWELVAEKFRRANEP